MVRLIAEICASARVILHMPPILSSHKAVAFRQCNDHLKRLLGFAVVCTCINQDVYSSTIVKTCRPDESGVDSRNWMKSSIIDTRNRESAENCGAIFKCAHQPRCPTHRRVLTYEIALWPERHCCSSTASCGGES